MKKSSGVSLIELILGLSIAVAAILAAGTLLSGATRHRGFAHARAGGLVSSQLLLARLRQDLRHRAGAPVEVMDGGRGLGLLVRTAPDGAQEPVRYAFDGSGVATRNGVPLGAGAFVRARFELGSWPGSSSLDRLLVALRPARAVASTSRGDEVPVIVSIGLEGTRPTELLPWVP
jgi:hypothetical protein